MGARANPDGAGEGLVGGAVRHFVEHLHGCHALYPNLPGRIGEVAAEFDRGQAFWAGLLGPVQSGQTGALFRPLPAYVLLVCSGYPDLWVQVLEWYLAAVFEERQTLHQNLLQSVETLHDRHSLRRDPPFAGQESGALDDSGTALGTGEGQCDPIFDLHLIRE